MAISPPKSDQSNNGTHDLFLSYNSRDIEAVRPIAQQLHAANLTTFLDKKDLKPGMPWMPDLEHSISRSRALAVFIGRHGFGPYQETEIQLAIIRQVDERKNGRAFPVIPVLLPGAEPENISGFLRLNHFLDLRNDTAAADQLQSLISTIRGGEPSSLTETEIDLCPYRALRAFREEDAPLFFGREEFAKQLLLKIQQHNLIAVVGPSGSGKSSVVQAGLMPLLRRERSPRPTWEAVVFTPGTRPFYSLATSLVAIWGAELSVTERLREAEELSEDLAGGKTRLENALLQAIAAAEGADRLLVVVNQFEELFTLTEEKDRKPFVEALLSAARGAPVTIVLTLRADFYGQAIGLHRELSDRMQQGVVNLGPMTRDELRRAIENPAHSVGLEFESGLVKNILDNIEDQPGNLPLLEFALTELWSKRQGRLLTHRQYEEIGEVAGAIGQRAEQLFGSLKPDEQRAALRAYTRLVRVAAPNEEGTDTRQRVRLSDLDETAREMAQKFVKARLLVTSRHEATNEETVEVAHEALIRKWQRLTDVLNKDREFLLWRQRLGFMSREWRRTNKDQGALLDGALLQEAKSWAKERSEELNEQEREFIAASESASQRPRYWIAAAAALVITVALAFAGWKYWDNRPESQINKIIRQSPGYVRAAAAGGDRVLGRRSTVVTSWLQTLALTGRSNEALDAARKIVDTDSRSQALVSLVEALVKAGKTEETRQAATEALDEARKAVDAGLRLHLLVTLVEALAEVGKTEEAKQAATEALDEARKIENVNIRSQALVNLIGALAKAGKTDEALDAARKIEAAYYRSQALVSVVAALVKAGKTEEAKQLATEALDDARKTGLGLLMPVSLVEALVKAGKAEEAKQLAIEALEAARKIDAVKGDFGLIGKDGFRLLLLASIVEVLAKAGMTTEALAAVREIKDADLRLPVMASLVEALVKAGRTEEAKQLATEALDAARKVEDASSRSKALVSVVEVLAKGHETTDQARTAIEAAQLAAEQITNEDEKSAAFANVATGLAKLHLYRQARELVDNNNTSAKNKLTAYKAILREYYIEHHPDQAKLFAELQEKED